MTKSERLPSAGPGKIIPGPKPAPGTEETKLNASPAAGGAEASAPPARPAIEGAAILHPRSFAAPAPDAAEALYYEGMAAYQHRNWEQALDRFGRLKELQPTRPGLDALLDEVRWFLQLQDTAPNDAGVAELPAHAKAATTALVAPWWRRWQTWGFIALALVGVVAMLLFAFQGRLPWDVVGTRETQELYTRAQARLAVGDYEGAQAAFQKILETTPGDTEARLGLVRAQRQQTLAQGYAAAEAAIAEEDWDKAAAELEKILAVDPSYADAQVKADFVSQRRRLAGLYNDGSRLYDLGQWEDAITQFERVSQLDGSYRTEAVAEFLFVSYLNAGQALLASAGNNAEAVTRAVERFSRALAIHPRNRQATEAHRRASLYQEALRAIQQDDLNGAQTRLESLLAEDPTYANGAVAAQYYALLLRKAETALTTGDIPGALSLYRQAQTAPVQDHAAAARGEKLALAITPTPTPRPTATPPPTPIPLPLAVLQGEATPLRSGPGRLYPVVGQLPAAAQVVITGRDADRIWLRVCYSAADQGQSCQTNTPGASARQGWVPYAALAVSGRMDIVAVITPIPLPTAQSGQTPRPSAQVICLGGRVLNAAGGGPLRNWIVTLQAPDGTAATARSIYDGTYKFGNLAAGSYTVSIRVEAGWRMLSPVTNNVSLTPGAACAQVDFWAEGTGGDGQGSSPRPTPTPPR